MSPPELEERIARLERRLTLANWRMACAAAIAAAIVGLACKPAAPDKMKFGDVELDDRGMHIGSVDLTKDGLTIGTTRIGRDELMMTHGDSQLYLKIDDRPQLSIKRKAFSVDVVAGDDFASVTAMSGGSDAQTLSTRQNSAPTKTP